MQAAFEENSENTILTAAIASGSVTGGRAWQQVRPGRQKIA